MNLLGTDPNLLNSDLNFFITNNLKQNDGFEVYVKKKRLKRSKKLCKNYINGYCTFGNKCNFYHLKE